MSAIMFTLTCGPITALVYWDENIPDPHKDHPGWVVDVSLAALHSGGIAVNPESGKNLAIVLAKDLCQSNHVDIPACLSAPEWDDGTGRKQFGA
jgi:hypothetical protein